MLAQQPKPSKTSNIIVVKAEPKTLDNYAIWIFEIIDSMKERLWPKAQLGMLLGPVDAVYTPLTQKEINELIAFWREKKQSFVYSQETWDCDDFALEFFYLSRVWCMKRTQGQSAPPAVGSAFVVLHGCYELFEKPVWPHRAGHVLNVILRDDGQWFFFEPMSGKMCPIEGPLYEDSIEVVKISI